MPADASTSSSAHVSWTPAEIGLAIGSVLLITLVAFEELAATTIMPAVVASFDAAAWYPIASGAALATQLSATVVAGALADWKGPRVVLLSGLALFAVGLMVCAAGSHVTIFVIGRALQGLGGGLLIVPLYVLVGAVASARHRPSFFASFSLGWVLPLWLAPRSQDTSPKSGDGVTSSVLSPCSLRSLLCPSPTFYVPCRLPKDSAPLSLRRSRVTLVWWESASWRSSSRVRFPRDWPSSQSSPSARSSRSGLCPAFCREEPLRPAAACRRRSSRGSARWLPRWVSPS